ncbi:MAG: hypothetical protein CMJ90_01875 [Planctomycetes bacterium]|nr:hypothetical protein [Planctomycetota bacterium]
MNRIIQILLPLALACAMATGQTVSLSQSVAASGAGTLVTYTVTYVDGLPGDGLKDFHILPDGRPTGTPLPNTGLDPLDSADNFNASASSQYYHWGVANSSYAGLQVGDVLQFRIHYPGLTPAQFNAMKRPVRKWMATRDGKMRNPALGDVIFHTANQANGAPVTTVSADNGVRLVPENFFIIGTTTFVTVQAPADVGSGYIVAAAFSSAPGFSVGGLHIPLNDDALFFATVTGQHPFTQGFQGTIPAGGSALAQVALPPDPALIGIEIYLAAVLLDPFFPQPYAVTDPMFARIE